MKNVQYLMLAAGATVAWWSIDAPARAQNAATTPTNPGFVSNTGQINPGSARW
jgi:hypothetical protein